MKVCPLTIISIPAPEICPNVLLTSDFFYMKSIPVLPWHNGTHGHSGRQHPSGILGVYDQAGV